MKKIEATVKDIGDFKVWRLLPAAAQRSIGPFVFWDHFGPVTLPAGKAMDVRPHPHVGLATVSYLFEGEIMHRDSLGFEQAIRPGAVNWMTAGRGIVHSERTADARRQVANDLHGLQIWLALPDQDEDCAPEFLHYPEGQLPVFDHEGAQITLIAGQCLGHESPVRVRSPLFYFEARLHASSQFTVPDEYPERGIYVVQGSIEVNGKVVESHELAVLEAGESAQVHAQSDTRLAVFGGETVGHRYVWWNFVASSRERIRAAAERWAAGGFDDVPGETEFIPLPDKLPWQT